MTDEVKKLIESVQTYNLVGDDMVYEHDKSGEFIYKSDLDRVVEELTKWNKVEEKLPDTGRKLLVEHINGDVETAYYLSHKYRDCMFYSRFEPDIDFILLSIIKWKYIY